MTRLNALLVEDSEDDALLVEDALRRGGYDVVAVRVDTGEALRRALEERAWDVVLADYSLPSFNAKGTLETVEASGRDIPVIVVSGTVGEEVAVETLKLGAEDYLLKQNLIRLAPAVRHALDMAENRRQRRKLEHMKTIILENSPDLICTFDDQGRFLEVSAASQAVLGYAPAELKGTRFGKLVHPDDLAGIDEEFRAVLAGKQSRNFERRCIHKSGRVVHLLWSAAFSAADRVVVGVGHDVTEHKLKDEALREKNALFEAVVESAPDGLLVVDRHRRKLIQNRRMDELWTIPPEVAADPDDARQFDFLSRRTRNPAEFIARVEWLKAHPTEIGRDITELVEGTILDRYSAPVLDKDGHYYGRIWAFRDITVSRRAQQHINYLATHDDITGLPNRNLIQDRITQAIAQGRRTGRQVAVLYADLDRFKVVNDGCGHSFGNAVLAAVGARFSAQVGGNDTVARLGGDEFLILLTDLGCAADASLMAETIIDCLKHPLVVEEREVYLATSIGVSVYPRDGETAEGLIGNADVAMYQAKDLGRSTWQFFTREMSEQTQRRVDLEGRLRSALVAGRLHLVYQPKASLEDGRITGCEALLRWHDPELGMVSPADFIPIAEESGLIVPIGDWVLRTACAQARAWLDRGLTPGCVAVNLSVRQFLQQDVVGWVIRTLRETGLPPALLELELTESLIAQDAEKMIATFQELSAIGVRLSIDDFGTGYSSLRYLKRFPVDALKIDQSFVRDMLTNPDDAAIVLATVALAHNLDFKVIAEGVESAQHCRVLRQNRCDEIQGYYFSRPVPASEFEAMLRAGKMLTVS